MRTTSAIAAPARSQRSSRTAASDIPNASGTHSTCSAMISAARPPCGTKTRSAALSTRKRLEGEMLGVARPDADADQPHALTSRCATSGVAAQWVCR